MVHSSPITIRSDLNAPSSRECPCSVLPALRVTSLPRVVRDFSMMAQPSSNKRRPTLTPSARQIQLAKGVPAHSAATPLSFQ